MLRDSRDEMRPDGAGYAIYYRMDNSVYYLNSDGEFSTSNIARQLFVVDDVTSADEICASIRQASGLPVTTLLCYKPSRISQQHEIDQVKATWRHRLMDAINAKEREPKGVILLNKVFEVVVLDKDGNIMSGLTPILVNATDKMGAVMRALVQNKMVLDDLVDPKFIVREMSGVITIQ